MSSGGPEADKEKQEGGAEQKAEAGHGPKAGPSEAPWLIKKIENAMKWSWTRTWGIIEGAWKIGTAPAVAAMKTASEFTGYKSEATGFWNTTAEFAKNTALLPYKAATAIATPIGKGLVWSGKKAWEAVGVPFKIVGGTVEGIGSGIQHISDKIFHGKVVHAIKKAVDEHMEAAAGHGAELAPAH